MQPVGSWGFCVYRSFVCRTPGWLPSGYGCESCNGRFRGGTIYNDATSGLIWVENQVSLGASETIMGKECFEQWLYNIACVEVKHSHGDNGIFSLEEYRLECSKKKQLQSFSGVGVQHQNSKAEQAIQTLLCIWLATFWCIQVYTGRTWGLMTSPFGLLL